MQSLLAAFKSVFWAILGVRKGADREKDFQNISITHILIASVVAFVLFIVVLMAVVHRVVPAAAS